MFSTPLNIPIPSAGTIISRINTAYSFIKKLAGREILRNHVHCNVTAHPTAAWTLQQLREAIPSDHSYRFLIRDRDSIFSADVDQQLKAFRVRALRADTKRLGVRIGNWLTVEQSRTLLEEPPGDTLRGKRDRAILSLLIGCGLRCAER